MWQFGPVWNVSVVEKDVWMIRTCTADNTLQGTVRLCASHIQSATGSTKEWKFRSPQVPWVSLHTCVFLGEKFRLQFGWCLTPQQLPLSKCRTGALFEELLLLEVAFGNGNDPVCKSPDFCRGMDERCEELIMRVANSTMVQVRQSIVGLVCCVCQLVLIMQFVSDRQDSSWVAVKEKFCILSENFSQWCGKDKHMPHSTWITSFNSQWEPVLPTNLKNKKLCCCMKFYVFFPTYVKRHQGLSPTGAPHMRLQLQKYTKQHRVTTKVGLFEPFPMHIWFTPERKKRHKILFVVYFCRHPSGDNSRFNCWGSWIYIFDPLLSLDLHHKVSVKVRCCCQCCSRNFVHLCGVNIRMFVPFHFVVSMWLSTKHRHQRHTKDWSK